MLLFCFFCAGGGVMGQNNKEPVPYACRTTILSKVINSYTENAGVAGQNNKQVAAYADLGEAGERLSLHARDRNVQGVECAFWGLVPICLGI